MDHLVIVEGYFQAGMMENVSACLEFIASNVALVQDRVIYHALAEKIAPGNARVLEMKMEGVVKGQPIEGIEPGKLCPGDHSSNIRPYVKTGFPEVYVHPVDDSIHKSIQGTHGNPLILPDQAASVRGPISR